MDWPPGSHASTFGGNPVACVAALATIKLLEGSARRQCRRCRRAHDERAEELAGQHPLIGEVRGRGLMIGVELVEMGETKERATGERDAVVSGAFARGLLVLGAGKNAVRFSPPLILTRAQAETAVTIFDEVTDQRSKHDVERRTR